jgi:hypothetical protein
MYRSKPSSCNVPVVFAMDTKVHVTGKEKRMATNTQEHPKNPAGEGSCVYCGEYDAEFREHFLAHFAANGGAYGRYSSAYELGYTYAHDNRSQDWATAESDLRQNWERRGQETWDQVKEAVRFGWSRMGGKT